MANVLIDIQSSQTLVIITVLLVYCVVISYYIPVLIWHYHYDKPSELIIVQRTKKTGGHFPIISLLKSPFFYKIGLKLSALSLAPTIVLYTTSVLA